MIELTDLTGLASVIVALVASVMLLAARTRRSAGERALLAAAVAVLAVIPIGGLPLAAYVRAVTGDLSITSTILLINAAAAWLKGGSALDPGSRLVLQVFVACAAVVLYPLALGIGPVDPYRWGYGDPLFVSALLLSGFVLWYARLGVIALCVAGAVLAWAVGWYESTNLWDYLIDPLVSIYAVSALVLRIPSITLRRSSAARSTTPVL